MRHLATWSPLALIVAACTGTAPPPSGNGTGTGPGTGPGIGGGTMTATQFLGAIGQAECDQAFTCRSTFPTDAGITFEEAFGPTASACYAGAAEYYAAADVEAAIRRGTILFDGDAAADCIAGISTAPSCSTYWTTPPSYPAACSSVMQGTVANGATCTVSFECADGASWCDPNSGTCSIAPSDARTAPADGFAMALKLRFAVE